MKKDTMLTFRVPHQIKEVLEQAAAEDMRPVGQYIYKLVVEHLRREGFLSKDAKPRRHPHSPRGSRPAQAASQDPAAALPGGKSTRSKKDRKAVANPPQSTAQVVPTTRRRKGGE